MVAAVDAVAEVVVADVGANLYRDRFGIGWRPEYAASILSNTDGIDIVEVVADNFLRSKQSAQSLRTLSAQLPITLHSVSLGMASSLPVDIKRLEKLARLFDIFTPDSWSDHFAFVRAGGYEIGHLAAPPRNDETIEGTIRNINLAKRVIGAAPALENIATLIKPPLSTHDEWTWIDHILKSTSCGLLLDLHNLLANCLNFGDDPFKILGEIPLENVKLVHLSGGKWIKDPQNDTKQYLLDDHLHDVPDEVFALLTRLAELCPNSLSVIIERDGHYPSFDVILKQLNRAKDAVRIGRENQPASSEKVRLYEYC